MSIEQKIKELAEYLEVEESEIISESFYDDCIFECEVDGHTEYLVLTDKEADERTKEYIERSVWAFNPWFIISHSKLPCEAEDMVKGFCEEKCESANDTILALIEDFDEFVEDAIRGDGRGHFLNSYDGTEEETENFFIYRVN